MQKIFLILGYGVPEDIFSDENYGVYLKTVFNHIYDCSVREKITPVILCSGGLTDCYLPYERSEAGEMVKYLKALGERFGLHEVTKDWRYLTEESSLSTLENLLNCWEMLRKNHVDYSEVSIFCEKTREKRVKMVGGKIFEKKKVKVFPIDFMNSPQRYLAIDQLEAKEQVEIDHSLWALESQENLKQHHEGFQKKVEMLRATPEDKRESVIGEWWESMVEVWKRSNRN